MTLERRRVLLHLVVALAFLVVATILYNDSHRASHALKQTRAETGHKTFKTSLGTNNSLVVVDPKHVSASFAFLKSRQQAYEEAGLLRNWHLRGIAHLFQHHEVLLVGQHVVVVDSKSSQKHSIRIDNVYSLLNQQQGPEKEKIAGEAACERLTLWVRVRGPEIFAGKAHPMWNASSHDCHWSFDFNVQVSGQYKIDAKVLLWNAFNRSETETCVSQTGSVPAEIAQRYPQHAGFKGFKLYSSGVACCTICTRQVDPPCRYWATPADKLGANASRLLNGCELYFDANVSEIPFASLHLGDAAVVKWPQRRARQVERRLMGETTSLYLHGAPLSRKDNPPSYFLGCGWHPMFTLDFPCLSALLDDKVFLAQENFTVSIAHEAPTRAAQLPLCDLKAEYQKNPDSLVGRWVKEPWPDTTVCPGGFRQLPLRKGLRASDITINDGEHPHCWHRDNLARTGFFCAEMNCRLIPDWSKYRTDFRDDHWMGVWRRYDCCYYEFTDAQLQQCIDRLRITKFKRDGQSVAQMVGEYVDVRIKPLNLYNGSNADGRTVTLGTLGLLHQTLLTDAGFDKWLRSQPSRVHARGDNYYFLISPFFTSSEREINTHIERMAQFDDWIKSRLGIAEHEGRLNKGYRYLNAFDMSAAMSYEVSGQLDGMHMVGPTAKMIVTKMFHYLCHNVVEGSQV